MQRPAVRTTNVRPSPTSFIGRRADLQALHQRFTEGRLITVLGPPGAGKTRLANEYALLQRDAYEGIGAGGTWVADLTEATDLEGVCAAVSAALDVPLPIGTAGAVETLGEAIGARGLTLLLLDNVEQVVDAARVALASWRERAPDARFLVTSREALQLAGEALFDLGPLSLPEDVAGLASSEAAMLFVARARAACRDFVIEPEEAETVARLVRQLDGLPLAIELCVARLRVLTPAELLANLERRFVLLAGPTVTGPARYRTLQAAIDASWSSLGPWEQSALAQCSVFRGFSVPAAEQVVDLSAHPGAPWLIDVLHSLCNKSLLIRHEEPGGARLSLLVSIRDYAAERLEESGEAAVVEARHARYFCEEGRRWAAEVDGPGGLEARRTLALEAENLIAAQRRSLAREPITAEAAALGVDAALVLHPMLLSRGPLAMDLGLLDAARGACAAALMDPVRRCEVLAARSDVHRKMGTMTRAVTDADEAYSVAQALDDPLLLGRALLALGSAHCQGGRMDVARTSFELAIRRGNDRRIAGRALTCLGVMALLDRDDARAREHLTEAMATLHAVGDLRWEAMAIANLGALETELGRYGPARVLVERAVAMQRSLGDRVEGIALGTLAVIAQACGDFESAETSWREAIRLLQMLGDRRNSGICIGYLGTTYHGVGRFDEACAKYREALHLLRDLGDPMEGTVLGCLGAAAAAAGHLGEAEAAFEAAAKDWGRGGERVALSLELHRGHLDLARGREAAQAGERAAAGAHEAEARRRMAEAPRAAAGRSIDIRFALRELEKALSGVIASGAPTPSTDVTTGEREDSAQSGRGALVVSLKEHWFRPPGREVVNLRTRGALRRVMAALVVNRQRAPGEALSPEALLASGWPGQRPDVEVAAKRVYTSIWMLRKLGLERVILRRDDGYLLDPQTPLLCEDGP